MKHPIAITASTLLAASAVFVGCAEEEVTCPEPDGPPEAVHVVEVGVSESDAPLLDEYRRQIDESAVVGMAADANALVIVVGVPESAMAVPRQLGQVGFGYDHKGNPDLDEDLEAACEAALLAAVARAADEPPSEGSDLFGGVEYAMTLFRQYPDVPHHLVVVNDGYAKTASCNLYREELTETTIPAVVDVCLDGREIAFVDDLTVTQGGVGLREDGTPDTSRAAALIDLWEHFWADGGLPPEAYTVVPTLTGG